MIRRVSNGNERACFARTPRRPGNAAMRSLSAFALRAMARRAPVRSAKEMCHSTKRTHRFLGIFLMQLPLHAGLAAEILGNFRWFRLEKRTHREGVLEEFLAGWRRLLPAKEERRAGRSPYNSGRAERCDRRTSPSSPRLRRRHEFGASRRTRLRRGG